MAMLAKKKCVTNYRNWCCERSEFIVLSAHMKVHSSLIMNASTVRRQRRTTMRFKVDTQLSEAIVIAAGSPGLGIDNYLQTSA